MGGGIIDREIRCDYHVLVILVKPSSIVAFIFFLIPNLFSNDLFSLSLSLSLSFLFAPAAVYTQTHTHTYTADGFKRLRDFVFPIRRNYTERDTTFERFNRWTGYALARKELDGPLI